MLRDKVVFRVWLLESTDYRSEDVEANAFDVEDGCLVFYNDTDSPCPDSPRAYKEWVKVVRIDS